MRTRVRPETWTRYEGLIRVQVTPRCGRVKLAALRPHHLQAVLDGMLADGAPPASVVKTHVVIASSPKRTVRWQLLATSPAVGVSSPRVSRPALRIPDAAEMRRLLEGARGDRYELPILLAATTGMRRSEIVSLRGPKSISTLAS
jgi:integrase